jgi:hypothetical protein
MDILLQMEIWLNVGIIKKEGGSAGNVIMVYIVMCFITKNKK